MPRTARFSMVPPHAVPGPRARRRARGAWRRGSRRRLPRRADGRARPAPLRSPGLRWLRGDLQRRPPGLPGRWLVPGVWRPTGSPSGRRAERRRAPRSGLYSGDGSGPRVLREKGLVREVDGSRWVDEIKAGVLQALTQAAPPRPPEPTSADVHDRASLAPRLSPAQDLARDRAMSPSPKRTHFARCPSGLPSVHSKYACGTLPVRFRTYSRKVAILMPSGRSTTLTIIV